MAIAKSNQVVFLLQDLVFSLAWLNPHLGQKLLLRSLAGKALMNRAVGSAWVLTNYAFPPSLAVTPL